MATSQSIIAPFPDCIDRFRFGDYVSGLVDGEGHFSLSVSRTRDTLGYHTSFSIKFRDDDVEILSLIQSFFNAGVIRRFSHNRGHPNDNPQAKLEIYRKSDLALIIIPHFEKHPLYAKKRRDFAIWKQGVVLAHAVAKRRHAVFPAKGMRFWSDVNHKQFMILHDQLRDIRRYENGDDQPSQNPVPTIRDVQSTLFA